MKTNPRVGLYYMVGAVALLTLAWVLAPWGYVLLWPGLSLGLVALAYFGSGGKIYGKKNGAHPAWSKLLHLFTICGHEISRRAYAKNSEPWNNLAPKLLIGRQLTRSEISALLEESVTAVLDLTAEFSEPLELRELNYLNLPLLDLTAPGEDELQTALDFIDRHIETGTVYIHCKIGYSRTAAISGCYLLHSRQAKDPDEVFALLRRARPSIVIRPEAREAIEKYGQQCPLR
ncbi:MAG: dual specificity protein phosphatase family protein [Opitutales bacterium]